MSSVVNGKIASLAELRTFCDLADLHDTAASSEEACARMTAMLRENPALDVTNLTENLDGNSMLDEKHEAALLLIKIIEKDVYLTSINLSYNKFSSDDMKIILHSINSVKEFSRLKEISMLDSVDKKDVPRLATELLLLKKQYGKSVQLDPSVAMMLAENKKHRGEVNDSDSRLFRTAPAVSHPQAAFHSKKPKF